MKKIFYAISIILVIFVIVDGCVARRNSVVDQTQVQSPFDVSDDAEDAYYDELDDEYGDDEYSDDENSEIADEDTETEEVNSVAIAGLEMPAERTDGRYPEAVTLEIMSGDERNYAVYYDTKTYTALWVAYPLAAHHMGENKRPSGWGYNPMLSTSDQVNLCSRSYNDDYSRGHLIPNASRNGDREMQVQTFFVTNSVPQIQNKFNGGIWQRLESALQGIAHQETIFIVTGVAFEKLGEKLTISYTTAKDDTKQVPVPNYFYKVVLKVKSDSEGNITDAQSVGFWFEHRTYDDSFDNYAVSVDQIESWTGFDYFPSLDDKLETRAEQNDSWKAFKAW